MYNNKQVMSDRWNSKWRPPPSWIYYFCLFWSKFYSFTSIGGRVIAVCAKIQDGGCRHLDL